MTEITDEMCKRAIAAMKPDRIQGFSTPHDKHRTKWGAPHYIRDVYLPPGQQEIWSGDSHEEMMARCAIEKMRLALRAALGETTPSRAALMATLGDIISVYEWCSVDSVDRGYSSLDNEVHRAKHLLALSNGMCGGGASDKV